MDHDLVNFINALRVIIGLVALTMVPAVIVVVFRALCVERKIWFEATALYAGAAASVTGFVIVFACFFAPR
jgi:hypothetical protein